MDTREYDWQLGDLAMQGLYPDERGFQPTPTPPEKAWPVPTTGMAPWPYQPLAPAQSEAEAAQQAREAAAYQIRRPYQTAATRPPESNRLTAVAGAIGSAPQAIGNLAAIPGQTMEPNPYQPGSEEADFYERARKSNTYQKAPELAFNLMGSGTAFAQPGAAGMFGGKLAQTADLDKMRKAEEMVQYGKTASDIRKETNWFPTIGGILKYEIPDRGTNWVKGMEPSKILQSNLPASAEFGRVYKHPELFEAYPDLAKMPLVISKNLGRGTRGGFQPPDVEGELGKVFIASPASGKAMRNVVLHEAGHVVQGIEDWPIGGSPFRPVKEGTPAWDIYQRIKKDATAPMSREEYSAMIRDMGILTAPPDAYEKYIAGYKYDLPKSKDDQLKRWAAAEAYRRLAGEVESRNIQTRKDYTKEQRRIISPEASQDVPYSEQIVERERRRPSLPDIPDDLSMGSLADQSRLQLSQEKPVGFAPGSVLTPEQRTALPKNWRDLPGENAPFAQYAEQYPPVGPPTMVPKDSPKFKGETYPEKTLTPEGEAFVKARNKIMSDMKKGGYEPYFDPEKRYYADPSKYPAANVDTLTVTPKKAETIAEYEKVIDTPETRKMLREAFARGEKLGNAHDWYAMGQLEGEYIKELGAKEGRKKFLEEFAVPMAATTSGNKPINNLLMAHYFEMLRKKGQPIPEGHQFPPPVGGRRANVNMRDYESVMKGGGYSALGAGQPKMHNFSRSFIGDLSRAVMDEQMAGGSLAHAPDKAFVDKARTTGFGLLERQLHTEAARKGIQPGNFQDVAWAGFKGEAGRPMITEINEAIERTHRLTGMPRSEIVRRGLVRKEIPLYGAGGAALMGGLAAQDDYRQ